MMSTFQFCILLCLAFLTKSQNYRKIIDVDLTATAQISFTGETQADCETECDAEPDCFAFVITSGASCVWYMQRFGFNDAIFSYDVDSIYYEKPIDQDDTLQDQIQSRIDNIESGNPDDFLVFYRQAVTEFRVDNPSDSIVSMTTTDAEECAKYCTRRRGVIDDETGTRCHSFNYNSDTQECQLLPQYLQEEDDGSDDLIYSQDSSWAYYEKLMGDGCWVISQGCLQDPSLFTSDSSVLQVTDTWSDTYESFCMENAKYYHEEVCIGMADVPTHVYWGSSGAYGSWNSLDFTTGCVIDLKDKDCEFTNDNNQLVDRFDVGEFRDSIGEDQFAAWYSSTICFERAQIWFEACELDSTSDQIQISFPDTGEYVFYPFEECTCDTYGIKIDPASGLEYCRRDFVNNTCSRTRSSGIIDVYTFPDALCLDTSDCDQYRGLTYEFTSRSNCYLLDPTCKSGEVDFSDIDSIYYEIGCGGEEDYNSWECSAFTSEDYCFTMAEEFSKLCKNEDDTSEDQFAVWYKPTGNIDLYPESEEPYETTLIAAIDHDAAFTVSPDDGVNDDDEEILLADLSGGRYQTFTGTGKGSSADETPWLRSISVYYAPPDVDDRSELTTQGLILALYEGVGAVQSYSLTTSEIEVDLRNISTDGEYIHFPIDDDVTLNELDTYTWSLTTSDANREGGRVGYVSGNYYTDGASSFGNSWDHLFVLWVEYYDGSTFGLLNVNNNNRNLRPWFEIWFWILIAFYICLIIFLIFLHWKRKKEEKEDKERERQLQKDVINQYRTEALKGGNDDDDDNNKTVELENSEERKDINSNNLNPSQTNQYESVPRESALIELQDNKYSGGNDIEEIDDHDNMMDSSEDINNSDD